MIGTLTFVYGTGQILGPSASGILITKFGDFHSSLLLAGFVLILRMSCLFVAQRKTAIAQALSHE